MPNYFIRLNIYNFKPILEKYGVFPMACCCCAMARFFELFRVHWRALVHARCVQRIALARINRSRCHHNNAKWTFNWNGTQPTEVFRTLRPPSANGICCCVATLAIKIIAHVALLPFDSDRQTIDHNLIEGCSTQKDCKVPSSRIHIFPSNSLKILYKFRWFVSQQKTKEKKLTQTNFLIQIRFLVRFKMIEFCY